MKHFIILTLLTLFSKTVRSQDSREVNLINRLNDFFCFDYNIFLLMDSVKDHNRHIPANSNSGGHITPQTVYICDYKNIDTKRYELESLTTVTSKNTFLIVVAADAKSFKFTNDTQTILDIVIAIRQRMTDVKIGIFFESDISSMDTVLQIFQWSWSNGIVNIFCAFYWNVEDDLSSSFTVFRFDPFSTDFLINLTGTEALRDYFFSKVPNYHQHPLRLLELYNWETYNFEINFVYTVLRMFNATMSITYAYEEDYYELGFKAMNADLSLFARNLIEGLILHPVGRSQLLVIVPHSRPYSNIIAYLQNATWAALFACTFVVVVATSIILSVSNRSQTDKRISFFRYVADVINLLINDNAAIKYGQLRRADIFIVVPLTFTGLIVANGILSVFKSYLIVPIFERQIKTMDELFYSNLPILCRGKQWRNETIPLLESLSTLSGWSEKLDGTFVLTYLKELYTFNNSVAYTALNDYVRWTLGAQKRLNLKAYYLLTGNVLMQYFVTLDVNPDYPFINRINVIFLRLQSAGLIDKWEKDDDEGEIKKIMEANFGRPFDSNVDNSNSGDLSGLAKVICCGWTAGVIVFICELIWKKFQPQIDRFRQRLCNCIHLQKNQEQISAANC